MNNNKLMATIVLATISIMLVGTMMVPIFNNLSEDTVVHNTVGDRATLVEDAANAEDELTIVLSYASPSITVNGESIEAPETYGKWYEVFVSDEVAFHYQWMESNAVISHTTYSTTQNQGAVVVMTNDVTITVSGSTVTFAWNTYSVSRTIEWYSYLDPEGDHVQALMYSGIPETTVYFNDIDDVRGYTIGGNKVYSFIGTDVVVNKLNGESSAELTATYENGVLGSNHDIKTMEIMRNGGSYTIVDGTSTAHPFSYVLPYEVSAPTALKEYNSLITVIPVLVIFSLVIGVVALIIRRD